MGRRKVRLAPLDGFIHYSLALYFALQILLIIGYFVFGRFGLFGVDSSIDISFVKITGIMLAPISLVFYFIQREKLQFQFIQTSTDFEKSKKMINEIVKEQKWSIRSFKDNVYTIKTNPGFVNQSWGQHITIQVVNGGVLVNSIFDTNKGSWLITFGSNQKNINNIRQTIESKTGGQKNESVA